MINKKIQYANHHLVHHISQLNHLILIFLTKDYLNIMMNNNHFYKMIIYFNN